MKIAIGSDHRGFELKKTLIAFLETLNIATEDMGPFSDSSADYPEFANMPPDNAADYLIHLRDTGKITITLDTVGSQIICQIEDTDR